MCESNEERNYTKQREQLYRKASQESKTKKNRLLLHKLVSVADDNNNDLCDYNATSTWNASFWYMLSSLLAKNKGLKPSRGA